MPKSLERPTIKAAKFLASWAWQQADEVFNLPFPVVVQLKSIPAAAALAPYEPVEYPVQILACFPEPPTLLQFQSRCRQAFN
jgi:hypothetical protein